MDTSTIVAAVAPRGTCLPSRKPACDGFSLIELLVVVIIVGILAAVAIPTFLAQRVVAEEAAVQSDLRNAGTIQVGRLQAGQGPASNLAELLDLGFRPSSSVEIVDADFLAGDAEFCIEGRPANGNGRTWAVSSDDGLRVVVDDGC